VRTTPTGAIDEALERPRRLSTFVQVGAGAVLFGLVVLAVVREWPDVRSTVVRMSPRDLALSELLAFAGLGASVLTWQRSMRELGWNVGAAAASKIYLLGQLGKYVPGSVWALFFQMELARRTGVPRSRAITAALVAVVINLATGLAIGLLVVPRVAESTVWGYLAVALLLVLFVGSLVPPVLNRLVALLLRVTRRPGLERGVTWIGVLVGSGWSLVSWAAYGTSLWVLAVAAGAPAGASFPLCLAGVSLAMTTGFLVIVAPSGIGVREAVLVAALAPVLSGSAALAVALVLRLVFTVADLVAAAAAAPVKLRA
jgi:glycosyltransferase 2 family protein